MDLSNSRNTAGSLEKKRARDRRAQQRQRDKRNEQTRVLEQQVQHLQHACDALRRENLLLRARQERVSAIVRSWDPDDLAPNVPAHRPARLPWPSPMSLAAFTEADLPSLISLAPKEAVQPLAEWALVPRYVLGNSNSETHTLWLHVDPQIAAEAPETPSPLDLLYGSKRNPMADHIHNSMRYWRCRDPERLAAGWLLYITARWILKPSEATFACIPEFLRPVPEQLSQSHVSCIDGFVFPQLRRNLILKHDQYNFVKVVGLFA